MGLLRILKNRKRVLGLNDRYLTYIRNYNSKRAIEIADDKLLTKKFLKKADIANPKLLGIISNYEELNKFDFETLPKSFVLKPVSGIEGGGIDIFYNKDDKGNWIRANKSRVSLEELKQQIKDILDGRFSINNKPDKAFFEERVRSHKIFKYYSYKGSPDVRIIVFNGVPIMTFLRLPTKESDGKANLALGALGLGIDIASGITTTGIHGKSGDIEFIPGTQIRVSGLKIPYWDKILKYSIEAQKVTKLNFAAIDFLIDEDKGPMIVEMNARPGLSIQLANDDGLRWRLKKARGLKIKTVEKGIRIAKDLFGGEIEEEIETLTGKEVIGIIEKVELYKEDKVEIETLAKIDTGADSTSIDKSIAEKLGFKNLIEDLKKFENTELPNTSELVLQKCREIEQELMPKYENLIGVNYIKSSHGQSIRPSVKIQIKIKDYLFETNATIYDRSQLTYSMIIGRKSLTKFLIDPSKKKITKKS